MTTLQLFKVEASDANGDDMGWYIVARDVADAWALYDAFMIGDDPEDPQWNDGERPTDAEIDLLPGVPTQPRGVIDWNTIREKTREALTC